MTSLRRAVLLAALCLLAPPAAALTVDADVQVPVGISAAVGANVAGNVHGAVGLVGTGLSSAGCDWLIAVNSLLSAHATSDNLALASSGSGTTATGGLLPVSTLALATDAAGTNGTTGGDGDGGDADVTLQTQRSVIDASVAVDGGVSRSDCAFNLTHVRINATLADGFGLPPPTEGATMVAATDALDLSDAEVLVDAQVPIGVAAAVSANVIGNVVLDVDALVMGSSFASCNMAIAANTKMVSVTTATNTASAGRGDATTGFSTMALTDPLLENGTLPDVNATLPNATLPNATLPGLPEVPDLSLLGLLGLPDILVDVDITGADTASRCASNVTDLEIVAGAAPVAVSSTTTLTR